MLIEVGSTYHPSRASWASEWQTLRYTSNGVGCLSSAHESAMRSTMSSDGQENWAIQRSSNQVELGGGVGVLNVDVELEVAVESGAGQVGGAGHAQQEPCFLSGAWKM